MLKLLAGKGHKPRSKKRKPPDLDQSLQRHQKRPSESENDFGDDFQSSAGGSLVWSAGVEEEDVEFVFQEGV